MYLQLSDQPTSAGAIVLRTIYQTPRWKPQLLHEHSNQLQCENACENSSVRSLVFSLNFKWQGGNCPDVTAANAHLKLLYEREGEICRNAITPITVSACVKHADPINFQTQPLKLACQTPWRLSNCKTSVTINRRRRHYKQSRVLNKLFIPGISQTDFRFCRNECQCSHNEDVF